MRAVAFQVKKMHKTQVRTAADLHSTAAKPDPPQVRTAAIPELSLTIWELATLYACLAL